VPPKKQHQGNRGPSLRHGSAAYPCKAGIAGQQLFKVIVLVPLRAYFFSSGFVYCKAYCNASLIPDFLHFWRPEKRTLQQTWRGKPYRTQYFAQFNTTGN
jgi:hypothetical protein